MNKIFWNQVLSQYIVKYIGFDAEIAGVYVLQGGVIPVSACAPQFTTANLGCTL